MKRTISAVVMVGIVVVAVGGCVGVEKPAGPVEKITVAAGKAGVLVYIAEGQGFFEKNGLEVTIKDYQSGKAAADALIADEADISTSADFVFVSNSFDYTDLRVLGTVATKQIKELVARKDKGISTINDLRGKKIGVKKKSGAEFQLGVFLVFNGLSQKDVDAVFVWDPYLYNIKEKLGEDVVTWHGGEDFYYVLLTKEDWIENNPAAAERFMKSVLEAEDYIKDNPEDAKEFIKDRFDYDSAYIDYSWPNQEFAVTLEQAMLILFEDQARWAIKNNLTDATEVPNYLDYIYTDALEKVKPEAVGIIR
jgi:NitT/TauT family transport system substrate-binding protein